MHNARVQTQPPATSSTGDKLRRGIDRIRRQVADSIRPDDAPHKQPPESSATGGQRFGRMSIAAICLAVASLLMSPFFALIAALGAIATGILGIARASSPRIRGGLLSLASIGIAVLAIAVAVLRAIF